MLFADDFSRKYVFRRILEIAEQIAKVRRSSKGSTRNNNLKGRDIKRELLHRKIYRRNINNLN